GQKVLAHRRAAAWCERGRRFPQLLERPAELVGLGQYRDRRGPAVAVRGDLRGAIESAARETAGRRATQLELCDDVESAELERRRCGKPAQPSDEPALRLDGSRLAHARAARYRHALEQTAHDASRATSFKHATSRAA